MRVLYHHRIRSKDGQYVHVEELTRALKAQGHQVLIVGPSAVSREEFGADAGGVAVMKRWMPKPVYELLEFSYAYVDYNRLRKAVAVHQPDGIYERYSLFLPSGIWLKRRFGLPMLLEVNSPIFEERSKYDGLALKKLARWSECMTWRGADIVLPVTDVLAARVRDAGVARSRIVTIPNGVDRKRFNDAIGMEEAKHRLGLKGKLVLGFTGFVRKWHGMEQVIDFLADFQDRKDLHLLLVGDGPARQDLQQRARERGILDRITVTGIIDRNEVTNYLAAFDIALQPHVVDYASPLKLFEYLAMGRAVVAPATANIREVLTHGENALLFEPGDRGTFEGAVIRLCEDGVLRERLGRAASQAILDKGLTWENNARRIVDLFHKLAKPRPN